MAFSVVSYINPLISYALNKNLTPKLRLIPIESNITERTQTLALEEDETMENQELLTIEEMAAHLKVPRSWLYSRTRIKDSDFPVIHVGKYCRFRSVESVMTWIAKQSQGGDR